MEHILNSASWLSIHLDVHSRTPNEVVFRIDFRNDSASNQELLFSNKSRKAELLGLIICDAEGRELTPELRDVIKLRKEAIESHSLAPGEVWRYELLGRLEAGYLEFPGAAYRITPGAIYKVRFSHMGKVSAEAEWRVP